MEDINDVRWFPVTVHTWWLCSHMFIGFGESTGRLICPGRPRPSSSQDSCLMLPTGVRLLPLPLRPVAALASFFSSTDGDFEQRRCWQQCSRQLANCMFCGTLAHCTCVKTRFTARLRWQVHDEHVQPTSCPCGWQHLQSCRGWHLRTHVETLGICFAGSMSGAAGSVPAESWIKSWIIAAKLFPR
jgi:hypothetical protein